MNFPRSYLTTMPSCTKSATVEFGNTRIKLKQKMETIVDGLDIHRFPKVVQSNDGPIIISQASSLFLTGESEEKGRVLEC